MTIDSMDHTDGIRSRDSPLIDWLRLLRPRQWLKNVLVAAAPIAAGSGVGVIAARPGFVPTKMTASMKPAPFSVCAEAVAGAVASGRTGVLWVPRQVAAVALALKVLERMRS